MISRGAARMPRLDAGCRRHRAALLEQAMLGDLGAGAVDPLAYDHLVRCSACEAEVGVALRTRLALGRTWGDARTVEPPADAWPRLRARVERQPPPGSRAASSVLGLALGAGLSLALLLPIVADRTAQSGFTESGIDHSALLQSDRLDAAAEAQWLRSTAQAGRESPVPVVIRARTRSDFARYAESATTPPDTRVPRAQATSVE